MKGLGSVRVIDFSTGIAGAYAGKLLADAGADVIKVEPPGGDPMRRWSATRGELPEGEDDSALFRFLHGSKRGLVGTADDPEIRALIAGADLVIESRATPLDPSALRAADPSLVVLSITPFGTTGPFADRAWSELTIQAECGSVASRGLDADPPIMAGGKTTFWVGGTFAGVAALAAVRRAQQSGQGEWIDFSLLEVMNIAAGVFGDLMNSLSGRAELTGTGRTVEIPSIEPTKDGWVGFNTNSNQQYSDFCLLIEKPEWREDPQFSILPGRWARADEWNAGVRAWTTQHATADIVEQAALLRIPVAPVNDGAGALAHEHFRERGVFLANPRGGF